jgi:hypothetical protein
MDTREARIDALMHTLQSTMRAALDLLLLPKPAPQPLPARVTWLDEFPESETLPRNRVDDWA